MDAVVNGDPNLQRLFLISIYPTEVFPAGKDSRPGHYPVQLVAHRLRVMEVVVPTCCRDLAQILTTTAQADVLSAQSTQVSNELVYLVFLVKEMMTGALQGTEWPAKHTLTEKDITV